MLGGIIQLKSKQFTIQDVAFREIYIEFVVYNFSKTLEKHGKTDICL